MKNIIKKTSFTNDIIVCVENPTEFIEQSSEIGQHYKKINFTMVSI